MCSTGCNTYIFLTLLRRKVTAISPVKFQISFVLYSFLFSYSVDKPSDFPRENVGLFPHCTSLIQVYYFLFAIIFVYPNPLSSGYLLRYANGHMMSLMVSNHVSICLTNLSLRLYPFIEMWGKHRTDKMLDSCFIH